ncbi:TetR/AcrR family transcriptional regulator [Lachnoclostridium sp. Marseille-P6806]|uniref:TetR/AcrR family transcriptional regulator n=1 Tax=Lachnoclostridium sp. Marseille-P6806 TaxID=2364793 RepID=UPI00102F6A76|nr:TetR/AcrR family transcriptional regulator [Lachnoclostridium sp. Marseille-P6806]
MNQNDARVRYTTQAVRAAFIALLHEKPLSKLTVKEICVRAGINRATFYKHYADVYDLMEKTEGEMLRHIRDSLGKIDERGVEAVLTEMLMQAKEFAAPYLIMFTENGDPFLAHRIGRICRDMMIERLPRPAGAQENGELTEMYYAYLSGGTAGAVSVWFGGGMKTEPAAVAGEIMRMTGAAAGSMREPRENRE